MSSNNSKQKKPLTNSSNWEEQNNENKTIDKKAHDTMQNNTDVTKTTNTCVKTANKSHLETSTNISNRKTISTPSSLTQEIYINEHPKNSSTEKQQDISRTSESNNTQASVSKRTEDITITIEDTNMEKDSKTQKISLTNATTSDKKIVQEVNSPIVIIDNNNHKL
ncbi:298_t:CDS:2 [Scutellospora calospora]|uniref:298_t:CDS:1 n=1 Tax=Scutellospora calospora TaxID=85575 RepID=A0ACA9K429_9GLOM|nr:298_t:CDS:2 [Scutellospora calospora]